MNPIQLEEITKLLESVGIKPGVSDYRSIKFSVYGINYRIVWYCNQSQLLIGDSDRAAVIPFKYMYVDRTFPLIGGNKSIGFAYTKAKRETIFDREFPYECFRIPVEI